MDVARTALSKGSREVTVYTHSEKVRASVREVEYAQIDGVNFEYCKSPVELTDQGPIFADIIINEDGEKMVQAGTEKLYPADTTFIAVSQGPKDKIVSTTQGIDVNQRGLITVDENGKTTRNGIFAAGDVVNGAKTVVEAVKFSKAVADAMDEYMQTL